MSHSKSELGDRDGDFFEVLAGLLAAAKQVRDPMNVYCGIPSHFSLKKLDEAILKAEIALNAESVANSSRTG